MKWLVIAKSLDNVVVLKETTDKREADCFAKCIEGCEKLAGYEVYIKEII